MSLGFHRRLLALGASLVAALALAVSPALAAAPSVRVLADGLNNPRGIDVGASGHLFVAEAGAGRVDVIRNGRLSTSLGGLPVGAAEGDVSGVVNVAAQSDGNVIAVIGAGSQQQDARFNSVLGAHPQRTIADIQAYTTAHPDSTDLDSPPNPGESNPYGAAWLNNKQTLVTDAANNTLLLVGRDGSVQTVAKFANRVVSTSHIPDFPAPAIPAEAVPTSVAVGPDGYWYVGQLLGFPFTPGASNVWRIAPWARNATCDASAPSAACSVFADGLTAITGLDFGPDGSLYVVEMAKNGLLAFFNGGDSAGALIRIANGQRTELAAGSLNLPGDVAVGRDGTAYVTNWSISSDGGQVLAIR